MGICLTDGYVFDNFSKILKIKKNNMYLSHAQFKNTKKLFQLIGDNNHSLSIY